MLEIQARGKDGRPIVGDLQGASPTGGQVTSESRPYRRMMPGDVIRDAAGWVVITDIRHNGIHGLTTFAAVDCAGDTIRGTRPGVTSGEVRTDTRVDVDTLWQLFSSRPVAAESSPAAVFGPVAFAGGARS